MLKRLIAALAWQKIPYLSLAQAPFKGRPPIESSATISTPSLTATRSPQSDRPAQPAASPKVRGRDRGD